MPTTALGFLGLGVMGGPMARNLVKAGYPVCGFDTDAGRLEKFTSAGGKGAKAAGEAVKGAEVVFLSLPTGDVVRQVVLGEGGLASRMPSGRLIVDMSTTEAKLAQEAAAACAARGVTFLDAPVSGGEQGAVEATLSIMVGGTDEGFARVQPLLACMGRSVVHMGGSGMGQATKLINNMIVAVGFAAVCEGFALGAKAGLDPARLYEAIKGGWAGSRVMDETVPRVLSRNFVPGGTVDIAVRDAAYGMNMARALDVPVPMTGLAHELFRMAKAQGLGPQAQPILIRLWEQWLGITVGGAK
jgi:2-hydroxy-3-oxopropionate reductase